MMDYNQFEAFLKVAFPEVSPMQLEKFRMMDGLYRDWNSKINVISRKDMDGLYDHHVLHSLAIARYLQARLPEEYSRLASASSGATVLDLGTGQCTRRT